MHSNPIIYLLTINGKRHRQICILKNSQRLLAENIVNTRRDRIFNRIHNFYYKTNTGAYLKQRTLIESLIDIRHIFPNSQEVIPAVD